MKAPANTISVIPHKADQRLCFGASSGACDIWIYKGVAPAEWQDIPDGTPLYMAMHQPNQNDNATGLVMIWTETPPPTIEIVSGPQWRRYKWYRHGTQIKVYVRRRFVVRLPHPLPLGHYGAVFQILGPEEKSDLDIPKVYRIMALGHSTLDLKSQVEPPRAQRNKIWTPGQDSKPGPQIILPGDPT